MRNYLWISVVLVLAGFSSGFAKDLSCSSKDMTVKKFSLSKAVEKALEMNPEVKKAFYDTNTSGMKNVTRLYCQKFFALEVIMIIASVTNCLCSFLFARFLIG